MPLREEKSRQIGIFVLSYFNKPNSWVYYHCDKLCL